IVAGVAQVTDRRDWDPRARDHRRVVHDVAVARDLSELFRLSLSQLLDPLSDSFGHWLESDLQDLLPSNARALDTIGATVLERDVPPAHVEPHARPGATVVLLQVRAHAPQALERYFVVVSKDCDHAQTDNIAKRVDPAERAAGLSRHELRGEEVGPIPVP